MDFGGNFEKWQRLSVNVVASATARWRPLMDCECSRKMAGVGFWGEKIWILRSDWRGLSGDRMANSCLRDGGRSISDFGLLTVGIDVLGSAAARWCARVYRQHGFSTCFSGKFEFSLRVLDLQRNIWISSGEFLFSWPISWHSMKTSDLNFSEVKGHLNSCCLLAELLWCETWPFFFRPITCLILTVAISDVTCQDIETYLSKLK